MTKTKKTKKTNNSFLRLVRDRKVQLFIVVAVFAVTGYFILLMSNAAVKVITNAPAAPSIYISPSSQAIAANETFTISVRENSGTTAVNAVQANFSYPVALLDYVPTAAEVTTDNPNGISIAGTDFGPLAEARVDIVNGTIRIARSTAGGTSVSGDKLIAKLTFKAKATGGTANLSLMTGTALVSATTNSNLLVGTTGYGNAAYTIDTVGPSVSVSAPTGVIQYGSTYTISASANDAASDVTKVEIYVDGALKASDTTSPYSYAWATAGVLEGSHSITAKAYDSFNNVTTSSAVNVTVADTTAPTVSITAPTASLILSGTITVSASASDNTGGKGMAKVEFYIDGMLKNTDTVSPYSFSLDTKTLTDATHTFTAKAYDSAVTPNVGTSSAVSTTVDNTDKTPPTAPSNLRSTGTTLTSIALAWDQSTDNVGVSSYRLSRGGTVIYNGTALVFSDTGLTDGTSYTYNVVALDAQGNVSAASTLTISTVARKVGDISGDGTVNVSDLSILISRWNSGDSDADLNSDGTVNVFDLSILISRWG